MKYIFFLLSLIVYGLQANAQQALETVDYVQPLAGTQTSRWFFFNTATRPFGLVNLSPDTRTGGDWNNGYLYDDNKIRCFSHIHGWQLYGLAVLPFTGMPKGELGMDVYQSQFSHQDEIAKAGYYAVKLKTYGIQAELTSSTRVGMHRYLFPKDSIRGVYFDLGATLMDKIQTAELHKVNDYEIAGTVTMASTMRRPKPFTVYFVAQFSDKIDYLGKWQNKVKINIPKDSIAGSSIGAWLNFAPSEKPLLMKVALSYTNENGARLNMKTEVPHWDFDQVVAESRREWNGLLNRIEIKTQDLQAKQRFYTDLWHALLGRRTISDVDGSYCDNTGLTSRIKQTRLNIHGKPYAHYNFDGLWGAHWSLSQLWGLAYPEIVDGFCNTMLDMYQNGGLIPRGPSGGNYTFVMIGDPAAPFFVSAYHYKIRNWDINLAWEGLKKNAFLGGIRDHAGYEHNRNNPLGGGMTYYLKNGYVPEDIAGDGMHKDGASMTMEYAYQDWCLGQMALSLAKKQEAKEFLKRGENYKNLWDSSFRLIRPRQIDGTWLKDFEPIGTNKEFATKGFCESNSMIYSYYVPQDPWELIRLSGGDQAFSDRLNDQFVKGAASNYVVPHGLHGTAWIDFENQPAVGMPWLFSYANRPWLTQKWVHAIKETLFTSVSPQDGYHGDEDQGQFGSVGALMAMGLFDFQGGAAQQPTWQITAPIFERITIHLNPDYYPGKTFEIKTVRKTAKAPYIKSAKLNGKNWTSAWFDHEVLTKGGALVLELDDEPNKQWGINLKPE